jgi:RNA polymerase sigma-70 factor (ECF subfamily)
MVYYGQKSLSMDTKSDNELMKMITKKNTQALKVLVRRYDIHIFNFLLRYTGSREIARELIQETFTRLWFAAPTFDQRRGHFKGWLYTIALNLARNEMSKKEYTYRFLGLGEIDEAQYDEDERQDAKPDTLLEKHELKATVARALGRLQPHLREAIIMKNYQQLTFKEMAEAAGTPESTLKARYHRAIALLKRHLDENGGHTRCAT